MQSWYNAFCLLMLSSQLYEKWVSVRERNIKLLHETVTYIATTETVTSITAIEIVICIMHCRKYYLHDCNKGSHLHSFNKNCDPHICYICINAAETSNCIIATKISTSINVAESTTNIVAIEPQKLHNCNSRWHLHNCYRKCQLHSSNRNFHLQNSLKKLSLAEMVSVRDPFSHNEEI